LEPAQRVKEDRRRRLEAAFAAGAGLAAAAVAVGFVFYLIGTSGVARVSALFASGLVLAGAWLLLWSFVRRPPLGQGDDFLDRFLAGAGQALLLGAVLSFGFGVVGQQLDDERAVRDLRRDTAREVRLAAERSNVFIAADYRANTCWDWI
jgi:hypothetical protein